MLLLSSCGCYWSQAMTEDSYTENKKNSRNSIFKDSFQRYLRQQKISIFHSVCVCVWERKREKERERGRERERQRQRHRQNECQCVREREREREYVLAHIIRLGLDSTKNPLVKWEENRLEFQVFLLLGSCLNKVTELSLLYNLFNAG